MEKAMCVKHLLTHLVHSGCATAPVQDSPVCRQGKPLFPVVPGSSDAPSSPSPSGDITPRVETSP